MLIPFTTEQFLGIFQQYNLAIRPAQIIAYLLGIVALSLTFSGGRNTSRIISSILAAFWLWMGAIYHIGYFSTINTPAYAFGVLFILQGILFVISGAIHGKPKYRFGYDIFGTVGALLVIYAMLIYPLLGALFGHIYPQSPVFGVAPCPTTIFTFGLLLFASDRVPIHLMVIPTLWSLIGFMAVLNWRIIEDSGLLVAAVLGVLMIMVRNRRLQKETN